MKIGGKIAEIAESPPLIPSRARGFAAGAGRKPPQQKTRVMCAKKIEKPLKFLQNSCILKEPHKHHIFLQDSRPRHRASLFVYQAGYRCLCGDKSVGETPFAVCPCGHTLFFIQGGNHHAQESIHHCSRTSLRRLSFDGLRRRQNPVRSPRRRPAGRPPTGRRSALFTGLSGTCPRTL